MNKFFILVGAFIALSGCADMPPELVVMQNPKTGEVVQCKHDAWGTFIREDVKNCVDSYTKAGWINLTQSKSSP